MELTVEILWIRDIINAHNREGCDEMSNLENRRSSMTEEERLQRQANARKKRNQKRRKKVFLMRIGVYCALLILLVVSTLFVSAKIKASRERKEAERAYQEQLIREEELSHQKKKEMIAQAEQMALSYDFNGAIAHLRTIEDYEKDANVLAKISSLEAQKATMSAVSMAEVTHIFFHSLIVDTDLAFQGNDSTTVALKQWMTTVDEFKAIIQSMYENDYVLVSVYDLVKQTKDEDGEITFSTNTIYLPQGKIPYVLSIDDVCYYHICLLYTSPSPRD